MRQNATTEQPKLRTVLLQEADERLRDALKQLGDSMGIGFMLQTSAGGYLAARVNESTLGVEVYKDKTWQAAGSGSSSSGGEQSSASMSGIGAQKPLEWISDSKQVALRWNSTNLKLTADGTLNTIQDIHTGASPTFVRATLSQATGTAPLTVASTTVVTNLNADLWDGFQFADYLDQAVKTTSSPAFVGLRIGSVVEDPTGGIIVNGGLSFGGAAGTAIYCLSSHSTASSIAASNDDAGADLEALNGKLKIGTLTGLLKATTGLVSVATADVDYLTPGTAATTYAKLDGSNQPFTGDTFWEGEGSGVPFGEMYANNVTQAIVIVTADVHVEIDGNFTTGELNLVTFPDDHYLLVTKAGRYRVDYSLSISSDVQSKEIETGVMINGNAQTKGTSHAESGIGGGGRPNVFAGHAIFDLAANDQISLCAANHTDTTDLTMQHANMVVQMVGGT